MDAKFYTEKRYTSPSRKKILNDHQLAVSVALVDLVMSSRPSGGLVLTLYRMVLPIGTPF